MKTIKPKRSSSRVKVVSPQLPRGFKVSGLNCGIKKSKKDLGLIYSQVPAKAVGFFTSNRIQGAPLKLTQQHLKNKKAQAIVVNSGNANCLTAARGLKNAVQMARLTGKELGIDKEQVLVASTGIIGRELPMDKITRGIPLLVKGLKAGSLSSFVKAIMTTDRSSKIVCLKLKVGASGLTLTGIAKGAGMIAPNLATMLAFVVTDAEIDYQALRKAFQKAVANSFNLISVDGDMSTNDTAVILANGLAGNSKITSNNKYFSQFAAALDFVCLELSKMIVAGGEGATKVIKVCVCGAKSFEKAKRVALKVANSNLVKTAVNGGDPNWGRILAAAGAADADISENKLDLYLGHKLVLRKGILVNNNYSLLRRLCKKKEVEIKIDLNRGKAQACVFSCDLSQEYVRLNARYEPH